MQIRPARSSDYDRLIAVVDEWWGGRHMRDMLPRLFFEHFRETSFILEAGDQLIGFLCGFLSQTFVDEAYIHFVGVHPDYRRRQGARRLYETFFETAITNGRNTVRCVTSPVNKGSIAFHLRMGFEVGPGDGIVDGVLVHRNHDGPGEDRVLFVKRI
jgi:ribosomal protein S18 acetylase RimI-like enzyme